MEFHLPRHDDSFGTSPCTTTHDQERTEMLGCNGETNEVHYELNRLDAVFVLMDDPHKRDCLRGIGQA